MRKFVKKTVTFRTMGGILLSVGRQDIEGNLLKIYTKR